MWSWIKTFYYKIYGIPMKIVNLGMASKEPWSLMIEMKRIFLRKIRMGGAGFVPKAARRWWNENISCFFWKCSRIGIRCGWLRVVGDLVNGKTTLGMSARPQKIINLRVVSPAPRQMTIEQVHPPKVGNSQCASFDHKFRRHTFRIITLLKCHSPPLR